LDAQDAPLSNVLGEFDSWTAKHTEFAINAGSRDCAVQLIELLKTKDHVRLKSLIAYSGNYRLIPYFIATIVMILILAKK
jgi:hypothetical protein